MNSMLRFDGLEYLAFNRHRAIPGFLLLLAAIPGWAAPPANDQFAAATVLSGLPATAGGINQEATRETGEPNPNFGNGMASVWWTWHCPADSGVEINTFGSTFDTLLSVYTGNNLTDLTGVKSNDNSAGGLQSRVRFIAAGGTSYRIQVQGLAYPGAGGNIALAINSSTIAPSPVLQQFTINPAVNDVSGRGGRAAVDLHFVSPVVLPESSVLLFTGPGGDTFTAEFGKGDSWPVLLDRIEGQLDLPAHRAAGQWAVSITFTDEFGLKSGYGGSGQAAFPPGSTTHLTLTNTGPADLSPPRLTTASFSPDPVDVTSGEREVTLTLAASDDTAVRKILVFLDGPSQSQWGINVSAADRISGTAQSGLYQKQIFFARFLPSEMLQVRYQLRDASGRTTDYGSGAEPYPPAAAPALRVANRGTVDISPPEITAISVDSSVIDVAETARNILVQVGFLDPGAGVSYASVSLYDAEGMTIAARTLLSTWPGVTTPIQTTATITIPRHTPSGRYFWSVEAYDINQRFAGFGHPYGGNAFPAGFNNVLTIANSGPVEAFPIVTAISTDRTTVDISLAPQEVRFSITMLDTVPGLRSAGLSLLDEAGNDVGFQSLFYLDPPNTAPVTPVHVDTTFVVPRYLKPGTYRWLVQLSDNTDTFTRFGSADGPPWPEGFTGVLLVRNTGAVQGGPQVTAAACNQAQVDISQGPVTVEFSATLQDALTGLRLAEVQLLNPAASRTITTGSLYNSDENTPPPTTPVPAAATLTIPGNLPSGDYLWRIRAWDSGWRDSVYGGPTGLAFPGGFSGVLRIRNNEPVDAAIPSMDALTISPEILNAATLPALITFSVKLRDISGIAGAVARLVINEGTPHQSIPLTLTEGNTLEGTWSGTVNVDSSYRSGTHGVAVIVDDLLGNTAYFGNLARNETYRYLRTLTHALPVLSSQHVIITPAPLDAFHAWVRSWPQILFRSPVDISPAAADPDGDGLPNAVEFLCGTDPLLTSHSEGPDPNFFRAPAYSLTSTHLRVDYRLSAANAAMGTGNPLSILPQSCSGWDTSWKNLRSFPISGDLWRAETPVISVDRQFLRLSVVP